MAHARSRELQYAALRRWRAAADQFVLALTVHRLPSSLLVESGHCLSRLGPETALPIDPTI
jgi:hypothetical protein